MELGGHIHAFALYAGVFFGQLAHTLETLITGGAHPAETLITGGVHTAETLITG